jgi:L-fuculose-phosphate aldolase
VLENHGVVTGGVDLQNAFERFETLEFTAKTVIKASMLGPVRYLSDEQVEMTQAAATSSGTVRPGAATTHEKELRRQLCEFVRRSYQQRLMISTEGAFSVRLGEDSFLITPHRTDRFALDIEDIVLVQHGTSETGKKPSSAVRNHRAIYQAHPKFQAIVNAYPVNATAFSVSDAWLDTRTIPESYVFLREVKRIAYGAQFEDGSELAELVSPRHPIAILDNDGVQVCGTSILDAFDRLEVLESTAEAMINSRPLGTMLPMSDADIEALKRAFFGE